jgi:serine/threonine-protein kinase
MQVSNSHIVDTQAIFLKEHVPAPSEIIGSIGRFQLLKSIAKGGMGEVFLAFDTISGRRVALKRIRPDLVNSPQLRQRFLREARITSQLMHPSIIPIYDIHIEEEVVYYTMPFIAGETLKQTLALAQQSEGTDHRYSIASLTRIFLGILQATAYAHSKGVLHRDLKPENIIIGTYGQVIILDWGLTKLIEEVEEDPEKESAEFSRLTRMGKPVGTVPYMAPERIQGKPASKQTDIYALGVILYQILTLRLPFARKNMKAFAETWHLEQLVPPEYKAPYRDVPQALSEVVKKCLAPNPVERYSSCDELIGHIESFLEGRSEWFALSKLNPDTGDHWELQENILLSEHTAITRSSDLGDWYSLMISKDSFAENIRLDMNIRLGPSSQGIGCIICAPGLIQRRQLTDGYWLWLASANSGRRTTLIRSTVSVLEAPDIVLQPEINYTIRVEKVGQTIVLSINNHQQFVYISHFPVVGTHVGVFMQDADLVIEPVVVSLGSQNIMVNCLAVPDAFLTSLEFDRALAEYRRIGASFPGHAEGREALFRAGLTLLEQGKRKFDPLERDRLFDLARNEFHKLRNTPGAPLEYLGKALVYHTTHEFDEEIKCFELAFRRYKNHPLLRVLVEQVVLRMHEASRQDRVAAYHFICLIIRFLPEVAARQSSKNLFESLCKHWEELLFFSKDPEDTTHTQQRFCLTLAFWLGKSFVASEIFSELIATPFLPIQLIADTLFTYILLNDIPSFSNHYQLLLTTLSPDEKEKHKSLLQALSLFLISDPIDHLEHCRKFFLDNPDDIRILLVLMENAARNRQYQTVIDLSCMVSLTQAPPVMREEVQSRTLEAALWLRDEQCIQNIIFHTPEDRRSEESSPLFFYYGCFLAITKGHEAALEHFETALEVPYPRSGLLGAYVLTGKIHLRSTGWLQHSFWYEQHILARQLKLYSHLVGDTSLVSSIDLLQTEP